MSNNFNVYIGRIDRCYLVEIVSKDRTYKDLLKDNFILGLKNNFSNLQEIINKSGAINSDVKAIDFLGYSFDTYYSTGGNSVKEIVVLKPCISFIFTIKTILDHPKSFRLLRDSLPKVFLEWFKTFDIGIVTMETLKITLEPKSFNY